ncbi:MFS transporter [Formosa sediminum]|uniref:MFS transporter n=1 Tax=Formosa sediminum TaxID=2594004 RepID=A0A516GR99_9FLAO|nr:MFS transporter [Formosa sediminum]QDO94051.1 MFS transporter [Formosa sediminum]
MKNISNFGIFTVLLISSLTIMVGTVIAPSLGSIVTQLNFKFSPGLLITLPALGVVVFAPFVGKLLGKLGPIKMLYLGLIPYALIGVSGGFITNDYLLIANRFLLGGATVMLQVSITSFIAEVFHGPERMKLIAWQGMSIELGGVIFLSIGGVLGQWYWQYPFYIYLMALVCLVLAYKTLSNVKRTNTSTDESQIQKQENKPKVKLVFYASMAAMVLFFVSFVSLPLYLPKAFDFSDSYTGYYMAFISLIAIITASQMPKVVGKLGDGNTVTLGFSCFTVGYILLSVFSSVPLLIGVAIFIGIGFGFTIPLLNHMMIEASSSKTLGKNLGLYSMGVFGGQFLSTFIEYMSDNYAVIYGCAAALALLLGLILLFSFKKVEAN